ncbi:MAG: AAA family ATPase [Lachnospiraceae bacterium]|nr:AAA family ATPase [Lachnospiraceae bacterium]
MKRKGFSYYTLFLFCGLLALLCIALIVADAIFYGEPNELTDVLGRGVFVRSETVYLALFLSLLLPISIIACTVLIWKERCGFTLNGIRKKRRRKVKEDGVRFLSLRAIDKNAKKYTAPNYYMLNLNQICEDFRNFAASKLQLYYELEDIRRFVSGFAVSHLMVMQGLSGTGKTSLATAFGEYLHNRSTVISVQPMWKERADVIGYFNEFTKRFSESPLLKKLYEARYTDEIYIIVLDEMNIARVEYFFADFLSLMELAPEQRYMEVTSDSWPKDPALFENGFFRIPENVWFIGTANNDDSTFAISDKVYDRAMVMNLNKKASPFGSENTDGTKLSFSFFKKLTEDAVRTFSLSEQSLENVAEIDRFLQESFHITYGNRIRKQMGEYVSIYMACGGTEWDGLDDFLSKKVFRKLENQNPVVIARAADAIEEKLDELFGEEYMQESRKYLHFLKQTMC